VGHQPTKRAGLRSTNSTSCAERTAFGCKGTAVGIETLRGVIYDSHATCHVELPDGS
jgi:hypothetical protein